jgi:hypothetical protein
MKKAGVPKKEKVVKPKKPRKKRSSGTIPDTK